MEISRARLTRATGATGAVTLVQRFGSALNLNVHLLEHSITYRVAVGPRAGQKVLSLQSVPARAAEPKKAVAQYAGFSLHAAIGVEAEQRAKLERLARRQNKT